MAGKLKPCDTLWTLPKSLDNLLPLEFRGARSTEKRNVCLAQGRVYTVKGGAFQWVQVPTRRANASAGSNRSGDFCGSRSLKHQPTVSPLHGIRRHYSTSTIILSSTALIWSSRDRSRRRPRQSQKTLTPAPGYFRILIPSDDAIPVLIQALSFVLLCSPVLGPADSPTV